ncbi:hypothetical protein ACIBQ6_34170 [Nonomuraea sp. NPDC049655]|uniref:hypothetical protein n=1 Tax=Nonomuraea sp. NPDC049655 TaxID=3364355 RepID=UPI0037AF802E
MSLDEELGDVAIHQDRLIHTDAFLGMLRAIGLGVAEAQIVHRDLTLRLFGFVLLMDHRQDQGQSVMEHTPVPPLWLRAHPDLAVPHLREAVAAAPLMTVDEAFEHVMHGVIVVVRDLLAAAGERHIDVADRVEVLRSAGSGACGRSAGITSRPPVG